MTRRRLEGLPLSQQLIVSGMHRSGTSLVASILRQAGLHLGNETFGPGLAQPHGHFEDHDFFGLHEAILASVGRSCFSIDGAALDRVELAGAGSDAAGAPSFAERATALVAARQAYPLWGWKDPRTSLFLDLWEPLLPEARFLFLYRHPVDVALSLWRRNLDIELRHDPWLAFRSWELYNRRLLAFLDRHPERCFLAHAPALAADFPAFFRRLAARFHLPLHPGDIGALYEPDELAPSCQAPRPAWDERIPEALELYRRLEERADIPSSGEPVVAGRQRWLVQGSELLLFALLDVKEERGSSPGLDLRREYIHLRLQEEDLRKRWEDAAEGARRLQAIEGSRSYAIVRAWWRLRGLFSRRGRKSSSANAASTTS